MKRYIAALIITVLLVPLFSIPVFAANLNMNTVIPDEYMPAGYVTPYFSSVYLGARTSELVFFDFYSDSYLHIGFEGMVHFQDFWGRYSLYFSNPSSLMVRSYDCNGREIFSLTGDQTITISIPAQTFTSHFQGTAYQDFVGQLDQRTSNRTGPMSYKFYYNSNGTLNYIQSSETSGMVSDYIYANSFASNISIPDFRTTTGAMNIPITIDEFASKSIDYYVVQKTGSGIETSIDYSSTWSFDGSKLNLGERPVVGVPVAFMDSAGATNSHNLYSNTGAYYRTDYQSRYVMLYNQDLLKTAVTYRLPVTLLNRYLSHFGYDSVYYSEQSAQLSSDIGAVGGTIGDWTSAAGNYNSMASGSISSIQSSVLAFTPIFTGVWNILPSWFLAMMAVVFAIIIGRKILGR